MIYADHAATTRLSEKAREAMLPWLVDEYGNPSSIYSLSRNPRKAIADARQVIASAVSAKPKEVFFTSGGTEADNWALKGVCFANPKRKGRIITSAIEHHAILNTCAFLKHMGYEIVYLPVNSYGIVSCRDLERAITSDTILVSVMTANNEIGTIEPIQELAGIAHKHGILFHTDAVQAAGHIPVDVEVLGVDLLSASAHKFNGPKGVGLLYIREGVEIESLLHGGNQESKMRSGTENVSSIVGMAAALEEHIHAMTGDAAKLERLRSLLIELLRGAGLDFIVNGGSSHIPGSISLSFRDADGEMLLHRLDLMGIAIATGSACNSRNPVLSHVIQAIQVEKEYANGTIRITLGADNDEEQIKTISRCLCTIVRDIH